MRKYSISMGYLHKYPQQSYQDCHISFYYLIIIETYSNTLNRFKVVFFNFASLHSVICIVRVVDAHT